jgi:Methyltransferase domain
VDVPFLHALGCFRTEFVIALFNSDIADEALSKDLEIVCERFDRFAADGEFASERDQELCTAAIAAGTYRGFDNITARSTEFTVHNSGFREDLMAPDFGSIGRNRGVACTLSVSLFGTPGWAIPTIGAAINQRGLRTYLAETTTPLYKGLATHVEPGLLVGSEYFGDEHRSGDLVNGIRHEDLQRLSFPDASFDIVLTSEVLEHVPDAERAEREIIRVLRPRGKYLFTVPLDPYGERDTILAERLADGSIHFHGEPVYHGDPIRAGGILAYRIFSLADLERRFHDLGCVLETFRLWSPALGILGRSTFVHVATKNAE